MYDVRNVPLDGMCSLFAIRPRFSNRNDSFLFVFLLLANAVNAIGIVRMSFWPFAPNETMSDESIGSDEPMSAWMN